MNEIAAAILTYISLRYSYKADEIMEIYQDFKMRLDRQEMARQLFTADSFFK